VYVDAKVCVVDDAWLTVGSANLNEHSLFNDTEVNLRASDQLPSSPAATSCAALWYTAGTHALRATRWTYGLQLWSTSSAT
jgi:phosphatidylserine/phosphatidylglycerophosphate/cardiolipin synthase-like enzyme